MTARTTRRPWTRDELIIAINVYEKLPFGRLHSLTPLIIDIAAKMNRTPGSLAMKLVNLASLDPVVIARGRKGLPGASTLDRTIWGEYQNNRTEIVPESEALFEVLMESNERTDAVIALKELKSINGLTQKTAEVKIRLGQRYFRQAVLANFNHQCGVTGIRIAALLRASHIIPWSASESTRLSVGNGLALSALHDAAFDKGLITFDEKLRLVLSKCIKDEFTTVMINDAFCRHEGIALRLNLSECRPIDVIALEHHRTFIFKN